MERSARRGVISQVLLSTLSPCGWASSRGIFLVDLLCVFEVFKNLGGEKIAKKTYCECQGN